MTAAAPRRSTLCLLLLATVVAASPPPEGGDDLQAICRRLAASDERFYGAGPIAELEALLAAGEGGFEQRALLRLQLARQLLKQGRTGESIRLLVETLEHPEVSRLDVAMGKRLLWELALAHLQAAEDENCLLHHGAASCILPFRPEGLHDLPDHTRAAGDFFLQYLRLEPQDPVAVWLLNLTRMLSRDFPQGVPEGYRLPAEALRPEVEMERWRDVAPELGIDVRDLAGGAVMDDFDGDGLLDLVSSTWDPCDGLKAFRNDGEGGFEEVSEAWGLSGQLGGLNVGHADFDGDGRLDLFVMRGAWLGERGRMRASLLRNTTDGDGVRFVDVTRQAGLAEPAYPSQAAAWADFDLDGDLDLYVGNEARTELLVYDPETADEIDAYPSQLFRNDGDGTFTDVAAAAGVANRRYAKGVAWGDYDDDGDPDLYVSNVGVNRLYRNRGDGTFEDVAPALGVTAPERRSFVPWFFDFDNDGDLDLFVADYSAAPRAVAASYFGFELAGGHPLLYRNDSGRFTEVSLAAGLDRPLLPMGANHGDFDNDGWLDLYLGTGDPDFSSVFPNAVYRNLGGGDGFAEVTMAGGLGHLQKGHGVAFGDVDGDGDQDLFHQLGGFQPGDAFANALFENPGSSRRWITLRLRGVGANPFAFGARVEVRVVGADGPRSIHRVVGHGSSFGGSSLQEEIGLGAAREIEAVVIRWPGVAEPQTFPAVAVDGVYLARQGAVRLEPVAVPRIPLGGGEGAGGEATGHDAEPEGRRPPG